MGAEHFYGKDIVFEYFPLAGEEEIALDSLISARLYGPNTPPTETQRQDVGQLSTGHIGSRVTSWTLVNEEGAGPAGYRIVFPAVTDANPGSSTEFDLFYVALNFRAQSGGPELIDDEQIAVYRPDGLTSKVRVTAQDVYGVESKLKNLRSVLWVEAKIELAREELLNRLEARGYPKRRLVNLHKLNLAVKLLAAAYACHDLGGEENPSWFEKASRHRDQADAMFDIAKVGLDTSGGDKPDTGTKVQTGGAVAFLR